MTDVVSQLLGERDGEPFDGGHGGGVAGDGMLLSSMNYSYHARAERVSVAGKIGPNGAVFGCRTISV